MDNKTIKKPIQNYLEHHWTRAGEIIDEFNESEKAPKRKRSLRRLSISGIILLSASRCS